MDGLEKIIVPLLSVPPFGLGYPSEKTQSAYYPGPEPISAGEVAEVSETMEMLSIGRENTRLRKLIQGGKPVYQLLQASVEVGGPFQLSENMILVKGDHSDELENICEALEKAKEYAGSLKQVQLLTAYVESFRTGSLADFQESQKVSVTDSAERVEHLIGFIEPYRDPAGVRSEWEAMVGIADPDEVFTLKRLVESSTVLIRQLPWAVEGINDGKGPFEKSLFEAPDFTSVHG